MKEESPKNSTEPKQKSEAEIRNEIFIKDINIKLDVVNRNRLDANPQTTEEEFAILEASNLTRKELAFLCAQISATMTDVLKSIIGLSNQIYQVAGNQLTLPSTNNKTNSTNQQNPIPNATA